jgi:hypothetical protein
MATSMAGIRSSPGNRWLTQGTASVNVTGELLAGLFSLFDLFELNDSGSFRAGTFIEDFG